MICKNCQHEIKEGARFCTYCGASADTLSQINTTKETPSQTSSPLMMQQTDRKEQVVSTQMHNKTLQKVAIVAVLVVVFIIVFAVISMLKMVGSTSDMKKALKANDAKQVYMLYSSPENLAKRDKYNNLIGDKIDDMSEDLNAHSFDSAAQSQGSESVYDYFANTWGTLVVGDEYDLEDSIASSVEENQQKWDNLMNLQQSKQAYCSGVYDYTAGNYEDALSAFSEVIETDSLYQTASSKAQECVNSYIESAVGDADAYFQAGDYESGEQVINAVREQVESLGIDASSVDSYLQVSAKTYADRAAEFYSAQKYSAAVVQMEIAARLDPNNSEYTNLLDEYKTHLPFDMAVKNNVLSFSGSFACNDIMTANNGETYRHTVQLAEEMQYSLSGNYDQVKGTIFICDDDKSLTGTAFFEIYGDDKLLYTSLDISAGFLPQVLDLDVSGVQILKIKLYGIADYDSHGLADMFEGSPPAVYISEFQAVRTNTTSEADSQTG